MGTYCGNHVLEEVRKASDQAKGGEVTLKKTKEGSCGHMGGCTTAHEDLFQIRYEYQPSDEAKDAASDAKDEADEAEEKAEAEKKASAEKAEEESAGETKSETTSSAAEEKPVAAQFSTTTFFI